MRTYGNLHIALEQMRVRALSEIRGSPVPHQDKTRSEPPRVLVLGPEHSGKTTVCKILTNYAVRGGQGWTPFLVNVDPSEVSMYIPHVIARLLTDRPGSLGCSGDPLCGTSIWPNTDGISCKLTWNSGYNCPGITFFQCPPSFGVLVWAS